MKFKITFTNGLVKDFIFPESYTVIQIAKEVTKFGKIKIIE